VRRNKVNAGAAEAFAKKCGTDRLTFAIDAKAGKITIKGWREVTNISPAEMMQALESFCGAFLYTHVDTEGLMRGFPMDLVRGLCAMTSRRLVVAGGITTQQEVTQLHQLGIDAVVGMAIYSGRMKVQPVDI